MGVPLIPTQPRCPQAWLTEIHEYAQKDVVIMLLGNKVRAGSPFTPLFAVPLLSPWLGGMRLSGCSACRLGAVCLHPPPASAGSKGDPTGLGRGPGEPVSLAASGRQHEAEALSMGCSR